MWQKAIMNTKWNIHLLWEVTRLNGPARLNGAITDAVTHNQELLLKLPLNPQKRNVVSVECDLSALVKKKLDLGQCHALPTLRWKENPPADTLTILDIINLWCSVCLSDEVL